MTTDDLSTVRMVLAIEDIPMMGTTIIAEVNPSRLAGISCVDDLDDFVCLNLDTMTTLDFAIIVVDGGVSWSEGEPIQYDPESGMAIFKLNEKAISYVLGRSSDLEEGQHADLRKLAEFVRAYGNSNLYEFSTF